MVGTPVRGRSSLGLGIALLCASTAGGGAAAQQPSRPDTSDVAVLDELVVTADRAGTPLRSTVGAVTRIDGEALRVTRVAGVAQALQLAPGFALVDRDGSGLDPQPIVRGFYGGGEAEYVLVLLDGRPLNALASGLMAWELVPPGSIEAVEIVRGPGSSLYGDAAVGGVINLSSSGADERGGHVRVLAAEDGVYRGSARVAGRLAGRPFRAFGAALTSDGYRLHGSRDAVNLGLAYDIVSGDRHSLSASLASTWTAAERPGPLPEALLSFSRRGSDLFYRFDETAERAHMIGVEGSTDVSGARLSGRITTDLRRSTDRRTIPLAPDFAATKERELGTDRVVGSVQVVTDGLGLSLPGRVVAGVDAEVGWLDSEYRPIVAGTRAEYAASSGEPGALDARGEGRRGAVALFAHVEVLPVPALRVTAGARVDHIRDLFDARPPTEPESVEATHTAVTPRAGVSLRWLDRPGVSGSVFATVARSFKAATLDQLFDQRSIPVPFPPFSATTSNPELVPQRGVSVEAGAYQELGSESGALHATLSLSTYRMDMEDELDFDLATLRYVNIGRSVHRGVEAEAWVSGLEGRITVRGGYTLQDATSATGDSEGRSLRAIPRHTWVGGLSTVVTERLAAGVDLVRASGAWLDDQNTVPLRGFTRVTSCTTRPAVPTRAGPGSRTSTPARDGPWRSV